MKLNIQHILWAVVLLTACAQEEFSLSGASDVTPLSITVTDGGYVSTDKAATRATENGYRTEFTAGDACGLYIVRNGAVVYDNVKLTATESANGNALTWQPEAGTKLIGGFSDESYFLYYPFQADMSGKVDATSTDAEGFFAPLVSGWQPSYDQITYANYTALDLMTAKGMATKGTDGTLSLSFSMTHRMAMVVIEMPKTVYKFSDKDIPDYIAPTPAPADFSQSDAKPFRMTDGSYRYLVKANATAPIIIGRYADGKKEFTVSPNGIAAGGYKTYKIDGAKTIEKSHNLQLGDYFCKNSSGDWYIIPGVEEPSSECIGIVFYTGQHVKDKSDYSNTGIGKKQCHGYVVALTDVHNDENDRPRWEYGPNKEYNIFVGTSTSTSDWQGYDNSLKFHEFINKNTGWDMKHFPAALACETYGNRTLDGNGSPTTAYG